MNLKALSIIILLVGYSMQSVGQRFPVHRIVLLDSLSEVGEVNSYTFNTKTLYGVDKTIDVFNVLMDSGRKILLFSVLPSTGHLQENWEEVDLDSIRNKLLSPYDLKSMEMEISRDEGEWGNSLDWAIIKREGNAYYISKNCLAELFTVDRNKPSGVNSYHTFDIRSAAFTIDEVRKREPDVFASMDPQGERKILHSNSSANNIYLSKKTKIGALEAFQFWIFTNRDKIDNWNFPRGAERYVFVPGKGIVGGSYDFWFRFKPSMVVNNDKFVPNEVLWSNVVEEKVMIATELKE